MPTFIIVWNKRLLISWQFAKASLWVDENDMALYWNGDEVISCKIDNDNLQCKFGESWKEYLQQGNIEELYAKANGSLQKSLMSQAKGKGKGKHNSGSGDGMMFGSHISEY